jgi:hypothetical protein
MAWVRERSPPERHAIGYWNTRMLGSIQQTSDLIASLSINLCLKTRHRTFRRHCSTASHSPNSTHVFCGSKQISYVEGGPWKEERGCRWRWEGSRTVQCKGRIASIHTYNNVSNDDSECKLNKHIAMPSCGAGETTDACMLRGKRCGCRYTLTYDVDCKHCTSSSQAAWR